MGFLEGLVAGSSRALDRRINRLDRNREEIRADRRYNEQLMREDARNAIVDARWERVFNRQGDWRAEDIAYRDRRDAITDTRYDEGIAYRNKQDAEEARRWNKAFNRQGEWRAEDIAYRDRRDTITDTRYDEGIAYRDRRDAITDQRYDAGIAYRDRRDTVNDTYRNDYFSFQKNQANLANQARSAAAQLARDQHTQNAWYQGEYLKYLNDSLTARGQKSGSTANLDANTVKYVENMADAFAHSFKDQERGQQYLLWDDPEINSVQQGRILEQQGAQVMKQLMLRFPNNPTAAIQYLPSFWSRLMTAGEKGEYGEEFRKNLHKWRADDQFVVQEMVMFDAFKRGALASIGLATPMKSSGITELEHIKPDTPTNAMRRWGTIVNPFLGQLAVDMGWVKEGVPVLRQ